MLVLVLALEKMFYFSRIQQGNKRDICADQICYNFNVETEIKSPINEAKKERETVQ